MSALLTVQNLQVMAGSTCLVQDINLSLQRGEFMAIVGESGSGKSVTAMACCGLLPPELHAQGDVQFEGSHLLQLSAAQWRLKRRGAMATIFQDPMSSLNPLLKVSVQIGEAIDGSTHLDHHKMQVIQSLMHEVGLEPNERMLQAYPFELSGGQQQRIMIAMMLATQPSLLIADEPTTALDASTQAQVIDLLNDLRQRRGVAVLMITHDLSIVRSTADTMAVFHQGRCVEQGPAWQMMSAPTHPYTRSLVAASLQTVPRKPARIKHLPALVLKAQNIHYRYPKAKQDALKAIDITLAAGECLGIVGASGSGKSTLAKVLVGAMTQTHGTVHVCGQASNQRWLSKQANLKFARHCQYVFQDTSGSLNPAHTVRQTLFDALKLAGQPNNATILEQRALDLLAEVALPANFLSAFPQNLSGGQRQRIVIARTLAMDPQVLVCDEPVSALDAHLQKQVVSLLVELQHRRQMALIFIGHDLHLMGQFCDRLLVMDQGVVVEQGHTEDLYARPQSPALQLLLGKTIRSHHTPPMTRCTEPTLGNVPHVLNNTSPRAVLSGRPVAA